MSNTWAVLKWFYWCFHLLLRLRCTDFVFERTNELVTRNGTTERDASPLLQMVTKILPVSARYDPKGSFFVREPLHMPPPGHHTGPKVFLSRPLCMQTLVLGLSISQAHLDLNNLIWFVIGYFAETLIFFLFPLYVYKVKFAVCAESYHIPICAFTLVYGLVLQWLVV